MTCKSLDWWEHDLQAGSAGVLFTRNTLFDDVFFDVVHTIYEIQMFPVFANA